MKLCVVGTGYVGLVAGTCFSEFGNVVQCVDIDTTKIENLKKGILPIYEPGLEEMVRNNQEHNRLFFTTNLKEAIQSSDVIFIAVGTPGKKDGRPDISGVLNIAREIGRHANGYKVIVNKSTAPVGMMEQVEKEAAKDANHPFDLVSNPEFLREGRAIEDFMKPERIIIGVNSKKAAGIMQELYAPFVSDSINPILIMSIKSAELSKYACNSFLALKITFANAIANLCDNIGANYSDIKRVLGSDSRIGNKFLQAGIGYGGSCFPKDVRALVSISRDAGISFKLIEEVENFNNRQKIMLCEKIKAYYRNKNPTGEESKPLEGLRFAIWGLSFKPGTDDMRDAPSIDIIQSLLSLGAEIAANDPVAVEAAKIFFDDKITYSDMYSILDDRDALLILTEWPEYREPDFDVMKERLKAPLIFDGRNIFNAEVMKNKGFIYSGFGTGLLDSSQY